MASIDTAERTAQLESAYKRNVSPDYRPLQGALRIARYATITLTADSVTAGDDIVLGSLGMGGTIIPEMCRIVGTGGSVQGTFTLEKVDTAGTATALTGLATLATDETAVPFLKKAGARTGGSFAATDYLQLTVGTATALAAGDTVELYLAYSSDEAVS
jgi:hypothetical protein